MIIMCRLGAGWEEVVHRDPLEETTELPEEASDVEASTSGEGQIQKRRSVAQLLPSETRAPLKLLILVLW
jgi:hypothetical protein